MVSANLPPTTAILPVLVQGPPSKARPRTHPSSSSAPAPPKTVPTESASGEAEAEAIPGLIAANETEQRCLDWLRSFDKGKGGFLQYFEALKENYDADLQAIKEARFEAYKIEATFWECIRVQKEGHKLMFAKNIEKLFEGT